jgi:hypothetical protein
MKKVCLGFFFVVVFLLSMSLMIVGGIMDLSNTDRVFLFSKQHAWSDGIYLLGISLIFLLLLLH